jgi:NADH:ubiquinone oxidoreductase subunit C
LVGEDVARRINEAFPDSAIRANETDVWVQPDSVADTARFLKETDGLDFAYLGALTAVDYVEYFEIVYHLLSMLRNHSVVLKTRIYGRESPTAQSVIDVWQGADLQEREVWDLMGIRFDGHPNMKRILLWEGFPGHPLRKDFLG